MERGAGGVRRILGVPLRPLQAQGPAAGSVLRRARPGGLGSARPAFRPIKMLCLVPPQLQGAHCGRSLLQGSLPFTPHTLSALTQEKNAPHPRPLCRVLERGVRVVRLHYNNNLLNSAEKLLGSPLAILDGEGGRGGEADFGRSPVMRCLLGFVWAFPRSKAAGSVLRRARPGGLGSDRPAFRPARGLMKVMER
jgi:hypothetical protein